MRLYAVIIEGLKTFLKREKEKYLPGNFQKVRRIERKKTKGGRG